MSSKGKLGQGIEISRPDQNRQRQRMVSYAKNFKGIRQNRKRREK